jgi:hypothetical protein
MAGALIRVSGNRFAWHVKEALLESLVELLKQTGEAIKNFLPQLQTIFLKGTPIFFSIFWNFSLTFSSLSSQRRRASCENVCRSWYQ